MYIFFRDENKNIQGLKCADCHAIIAADDYMLIQHANGSSIEVQLIQFSEQEPSIIWTGDKSASNANQAETGTRG